SPASGRSPPRSPPSRQTGPSAPSRCQSNRCRPVRPGGRPAPAARNHHQAARQLGMRVRSYRAELHHVVQLPLPAIIHWNFNHFVVLEKIHANGADIIDPAQGRRRVSIQAFREAFTGIVITLERGNTLHKISAKPQPFWWRYLRYLFTVPQARSILLQIVIALLGLQVVGLSIPALTQVLVDETLPVGAFNLMMILGLGLFLALLMQGIITAVRLLLLMRLQIVLDTQVMLGFFEHLLSLPYYFFQQHASGDLLMRVSSNVLIREMLSNRVLNVLFDALFAFLLTHLDDLINPVCAGDAESRSITSCHSLEYHAPCWPPQSTARQRTSAGAELHGRSFEWDSDH
ncbi:hypothetical protein HC928_21465, partial [bacterium]|nr:hypothetical protein [bacterium]